MEYAILNPMRVYIKRRQMTIAERVAFWPVYAMCMNAESMSETSLMVRWLNKDAVNELEE